jgi:hypothetical protein
MLERIILVLVIGSLVMFFDVYSYKKSGYKEFVSKVPLLKRKLHEYALIFRGAFLIWAAFYLAGFLK